ncbi:transposase family protein [Photorhabdus laumondii]|uniref:transposase family protein n=1 Tax=Photorhabdus laumondii TaxID=2218628 RepID=UPI0011BE941B|nr:transposase family protein [Photorhabdus laumondii]
MKILVLSSRGLLKQYGKFEQGITTHDTIVHMVICISTKLFQNCFIKWMNICRELMKSSGSAADGKTVRRSQFGAVTQGNCYLG